VTVRRFGELYIPLISFIAFIGLITNLFFFRAPVILVSDLYFSSLYGGAHEQVRRLEATFLILKQIRIVRVLQDTDSLSLAEAVQRASFRPPEAVFFPYSYAEAAELYASTQIKAGNIATKTVVFADRNKPGHGEELCYYVRTDGDIDFFRAGHCASILAREAGASQAAALTPDVPRSIIFIYDSDISMTDRKTFITGAEEDSSFSGRIDFASAYDNRNWNNAASIIIHGLAPAFLQSSIDIPSVLFSWQDNINYLPSQVKVMVNDSPYFLIPDVLRRLRMSDEIENKNITVPSRFTVISSRIKEKSLIKELKKAASLGKS
jgi:hypothetical protein